MGDSLHQEIFASNKLFVSPQGKQLWSWNKNENIANMMIETVVVTLKQPFHHESQAMVAICHELLRQVLPRQKLLVYFLQQFMKYLTHSSAGVGSQVHRAYTEEKLHKRR